MNATFITRLKAFLFDYIWIVIYLAVLSLVGALVFPSLQNLFQGSLVLAQFAGFMVITLPVSLYFIITDSKLIGQSFGKKKMQIQVVNIRGESLSVRHSVGRTIIKFLPWELAHYFIYRIVDVGDEQMPLYLIVVGVIVYALIFAYILSAIFTKKNQSLYDLICNTRVIKL